MDYNINKDIVKKFFNISYDIQVKLLNVLNKNLTQNFKKLEPKIKKIRRDYNGKMVEFSGGIFDVNRGKQISLFELTSERNTGRSQTTNSRGMLGDRVSSRTENEESGRRTERPSSEIKLYNTDKQDSRGNSDGTLQQTNGELDKRIFSESNKRIDYTLTKLEQEYGGSKTKFKNNVEAIKLVFDLEKSGKLADEKQQEILSRYTGFGGIPQAFDSRNLSWEKEYIELKELLNEKQYEKARASTLTSFYTPPYVIFEMYNALNKMGFKGGKVLEPSMGIGNFYSLMPKDLKEKSNLNGVEIDEITGKIAKQLQQNTKVRIKGYQDINYPDNLFDLIIGNVPFGQIKINDSRYNKEKFNIHDYFFAKSIDKVKPNGVIAFITSKGTLDKINNSVREYIFSRAELIGAVRLPNNSFKDIANTEVTSDIILLRKREYPITLTDDYIGLNVKQNSQGMNINDYFINNPDMMLGELVYDKSMYGKDDEIALHYNGENLQNDLSVALNKIVESYENNLLFKQDKNNGDKQQTEINIDINEYSNYSYFVYQDNLYYRKNDQAEFIDLPKIKQNRIIGMLTINNLARKVIQVQMIDNYKKEDLEKSQLELNNFYDNFIKTYGYINSKVNVDVFSLDKNCNFVKSLETKLNDNEYSKSELFNKATISPPQKLVINNAQDSLYASLFNKGVVDIQYMSEIYENKPYEEIIKELKGKIYPTGKLVEYQNKDNSSDVLYQYEIAETYLSGNIKNKIIEAEKLAEQDSVFYDNITELKKVKPKKLNLSEIGFNLATSWIPLKLKEDFIKEILKVPLCYAEYVYIERDEKENRFKVKGNKYIGKMFNGELFGTKRASAVNLITDILNLKPALIKDCKIVDEKEKYVLNAEETAKARVKQEKIQYEFTEWVINNNKIVKQLEDIYNDKYNVYVSTEYNGEFLKLNNQSIGIELKPHQKASALRIALGGNTLLAHEVGAGKTFSMIAGAMLLKQTGLAEKSLFVVPNHLTEQWGLDFLRLFPNANVLVATKKDFEKNKRQEFISRIATGNYDAVIMSFTQFERIPMSVEHREKLIKQELTILSDHIEDLEATEGPRYSVKQLEKTRENLKAKLESLNNERKKDDIIYFENLGIKNLFVDEAHYYKNCFFTTKIQGIAGLGGTRAEKTFDLLMKINYINEKTNYRGVVFATGTPITNSISEMFVMQRYLQNNVLEETDIIFFDDWASNFAKVESSIELSPEGTGFRQRSRFAKFNNLPELMAMFRLSADIKLIDDLDIPRPKLKTGKAITVAIEPSTDVTLFIENLAQRAEDIRDGLVKPNEDNMLKVTNEGKKAATDYRLIDSDAEVSRQHSKIYACCDKVYELYKEYEKDKALQLIFIDSGISLYGRIKEDLINQGVKEQEIAIIGNHDTEAKKKKLFEDCRNGTIRVLMGSTQKMGAGTNVQDRLIALHHLDCPWRPADIEQRNGRILRQGNMYEEIQIYQYITKGTFDSYLWQIQEQKQTYIVQVMTNKNTSRSCEDLDDTVLNFAEVKALATGDTRIKDKMELDILVQKLKLEKQSHNNSQKRYDEIISNYDDKQQQVANRIILCENDIEKSKMFIENKKEFSIEIQNMIYDERKVAGEMLVNLLRENPTDGVNKLVGKYLNFDIFINKPLYGSSKIILKDGLEYSTEFGESTISTIVKIENVVKNKIDNGLINLKQKLSELNVEYEIACKNANKPFEKEELLKEKIELKTKLDFEIEMNLKQKNQELENEMEI